MKEFEGRRMAHLAVVRPSCDDDEEVRSMSSLVSWDPFRDLFTLQRDVDRLFSGMGYTPTSTPHTPAMLTPMLPTMDVFTRGEDLVIHAELPGIKAEDVEISVTEGVLTVSGKRYEKKEVKEEDYIVHETSFGTMERSLRLPEGAAVDTIHAEYTDGILEITVPGGAALEHPKSHKIAIETHGAPELTEHH
jgi:HSP20 family protein